jgi:hypothetical protein
VTLITAPRAVEKRAADLESRAVQRIEKLESRVAELEKQKTAAYRGVWNEGTEYRCGELVTHAGGLWHAWRSTTARPGTSDDWQLTAKTR